MSQSPGYYYSLRLEPVLSVNGRATWVGTLLFENLRFMPSTFLFVSVDICISAFLPYLLILEPVCVKLMFDHLCQLIFEFLTFNTFIPFCLSVLCNICCNVIIL